MGRVFQGHDEKQSIHRASKGLSHLTEEVMIVGRVSFVTGTARGRGNGRAIALRLAKGGIDVATGDILYEEAQGVAEEIKAFIAENESRLKVKS